MKIENEIRYLELPQGYSPRLWNAKSACAGWRAPSGVNLSAIRIEERTKNEQNKLLACAVRGKPLGDTPPGDTLQG